MSRRAWEDLATIFVFVIVGLVGAICLTGLFGPRPGAPEGQRTLSLGPVWIARIHEEIEGSSHRWWTEFNWLCLPAVAVLAAGAGYLRTRLRRHEVQ